MKPCVAFAGLALALCSAPIFGEDVVRHGNPNPDSPIAQAVEVPPGHTLVFLSGVGPDMADKSAPEGTAGAYGDTKTQTLSVLRKIEAILESMGLGMTDVVRMQVFLAGDRAQGGRMDFAGMMAGYRIFFGSAKQPNVPARSTMQVVALANPGWLVEIEVTAVRPSR